MSKVVKDGRLEALPAGREPRRRALAERARMDRKALAKLLAELRPLVEWLAKKQSGQGLDEEDLVQVGMEGAMKAVRAYTPTPGASFTSYAYLWIHGKMRRAIAWHKRAIRVPEYRFLRAGKAAKARDRLHHELGRTPTDFDVGRELGVDVREVWKLAVETAPIESVDVLMQAAEADDPDVGRRASEAQIRFLSPENKDDHTGEPERLGVHKILAEELREELRRSLRKVDDRDRDVLKLKHWGAYPRWAIAAQLDITAEAVRWSEKRAEKVLKAEETLKEKWEVFQN
jgi:RNA polymerase sigma-B factor